MKTRPITFKHKFDEVKARENEAHLSEGMALTPKQERKEFTK